MKRLRGIVLAGSLIALGCAHETAEVAAGDFVEVKSETILESDQISIARLRLSFNRQHFVTVAGNVGSITQEEPATSRHHVELLLVADHITSCDSDLLKTVVKLGHTGGGATGIAGCNACRMAPMLRVDLADGRYPVDRDLPVGVLNGEALVLTFKPSPTVAEQLEMAEAGAGPSPG